jgi:hypothetical protein
VLLFFMSSNYWAKAGYMKNWGFDLSSGKVKLLMALAASCLILLVLVWSPALSGSGYQTGLKSSKVSGGRGTSTLPTLDLVGDPFITDPSMNSAAPGGPSLDSATQSTGKGSTGSASTQPAAVKPTDRATLATTRRNPLLDFTP